MVLLWIVIALAVLIIILLSLNIKLYLKFGATTQVRAGIGFIVLPLVPSKKKKIKLSDYSYKNFQASREKEKKQQLKKALKAKKKAEKKNKSTEVKEKAENVVKDDKGTAESKLLSISEILEFVTNEFPRLASRIKIKINRFIVKVGGNDSAKIALDYGKLEAVVSLIMELLDNKTSLSPIKKNTVLVYADFLSEKTSLEADISIKISVFSIVRTGISAIIMLIRSMIKKQSTIKK